MNPIIKLENVYKTYRMGEVTVHALNDLSLDLDANELTVILGASGSGKTTLLNLIGGIDSPSKGTIVVDGKNIGKMNQRELTDYRRNNIGFIFQFYNLIPNLNARENLEFVFEYVLENNKGSKNARAQELLEKVGLGERGSHFPHQLSGGEQQRVAIARALAKDPRIILADEPTGELDYRTGLKILDILLSLSKENRAVIIVTHNRELARIATKVVRLRDGKVLDVKKNDTPIPVSELEW
ncbi:MAG: ABC transporter ATP-binding protein [Thermoplasmata archaeon]|nr:ABC transporter ATP-binding protein [Thermoplasmata archaeon]